MKHRPFVLALALLAACAVDPTRATDDIATDDISFDVSPDAGPPANATPALDWLAPPTQMCWWDPQPQYQCPRFGGGREPTCPTCCAGCTRRKVGQDEWMQIRVGSSITIPTMATHAALTRSAGGPSEGVAFVPVARTNKIQWIKVPESFEHSTDLYIWFVNDGGQSSLPYLPTEVPLVP